MFVRENLTLALLPKLTRNGQIDRARERQLVQRHIAALRIKVADMDQPIRELSRATSKRSAGPLAGDRA